MPSQEKSPRLTAALLAALWLGLARCGASASPPGPECDNLKLDLDLPADGRFWRCSHPWLGSAQNRASIDTAYDPEPPREVCMDEPIHYNHSIPTSGAFRAAMAASGEYLYCPPQRWLNNLHRGATVLLYHPCAPLRERLLLSGLARSCLPGYIISPRPQLSRDRPVALARWGRSLELTSAASSDLCAWLQDTLSGTAGSDAERRGRKYTLLLSRAAERQPFKRSAQTEGSVRRCCEDAVHRLESEDLKGKEEGRRSRRMRAADGAAGNRLGPSAGSSKGPPARRHHSAPGPGPQAEARADQSESTASKRRQEASFGERLSVDGGRTDSELGRTHKSSSPNGPNRTQPEPPASPRQQPHSDSSDCGAEPQRTPRTNEAAWAAAALGFLLVLLTLSVLHTRLYRHWRSAPSLYWHDPEQDYDSVTEVLRRLRMSRRRRKRGRRRECVLLLSSSSSDEHA